MDTDKHEQARMNTDEHEEDATKSQLDWIFGPVDGLSECAENFF